MQIKLNGQSRQVEPGLTVARLLDALGIESRNLAIEHNGDFLESEELAERTIREGDTLEIVRFVGGG